MRCEPSTRVTAPHPPSYWRGTVVLFFILAAIKGALFAIVIPLGQGPDEPAHVAHTLLYALQTRVQIVGLHDPSIDPRPLWSPMFWPATFYEKPDILENIFKVLQASRLW